MITRFIFGTVISLALGNVANASSNPTVATLRGVAVGDTCANVTAAMHSLVQQSPKPFESFDCLSLNGRYSYRSIGIKSDDKFEAVSISFSPKGTVWKVSSFTRFNKNNPPIRSDVIEALVKRFGGQPALIRQRHEMDVFDEAAWSSAKDPSEGAMTYSYTYRPCPGKTDSEEFWKCMKPQQIEDLSAWNKAVRNLGGIVAFSAVESNNSASESVISVTVKVYDSGVGDAAKADENRQTNKLLERSSVPAY